MGPIQWSMGQSGGLVKSYFIIVKKKAVGRPAWAGVGVRTKQDSVSWSVAFTMGYFFI